MIELIFLIISIIVILIILYLNQRHIFDTNAQSEHFENYYLKSCPLGYKSHYNADGNVICCNGDIIANKCLGDNQCTLNGKGTANMPNCIDYIREMYNNKSKLYCPSNMPNYYEDHTLNIKGCTSGLLNETLSSPKSQTQDMCIMYDTYDKNMLSKNSCMNQKQLDLAKCFGKNCTKELMQPTPSASPLVAIGFTDNTGMHRIAYTKESMERYLDMSNSNWRNQGMDLSKNINVAEVAKAYYIDRTVDKSDVMF